MRLATWVAFSAGVLAAVPACKKASDDGLPGDGLPPIIADAPADDAGDEAFVRRVIPLMWGRRPTGIREVEVLMDMIAQTDRATVVRSMARTSEYVDHYEDVLFDALGVPRGGVLANPKCHDAQTAAADTADLALWVRDNGPTQGGFTGDWTMSDLVRSSLRLDDVTPAYRANLIVWMDKGRDPRILVEGVSYRESRAQVFARTYLNRSVECLKCHNSEFSVTGHVDPALDRTWEIPGLFEKSLFGDSTGGDRTKLRPFFRRYGVIAGFHFLRVPDKYPPPQMGCRGRDTGQGCRNCACEEQVCAQRSACCDELWDGTCASLCRQAAPAHCQLQRPWGLSYACGSFIDPRLHTDDPTGVAGYFGADYGARASIWDLEGVLHRGVDSLRAGGLTVDAELAVPAEQAFAYMMATNFVDQIWASATGRRLTIENKFPRNQAQRDLLKSLTDRFIATDFSLVGLLVSITATPYFNRSVPSASALAAGYPLPPVVNPWSTLAEDPAARGNSLGDLIFPYRGRDLLRSLYFALQWPALEAFTDDHIDESADASFQQSVGVFLKDGSPGFSAIAFQPLLALEERYGGCRESSSQREEDWIDALLKAARDRGDTTYGQAIIALKDRLITDPDLSDAEERQVLEALVGAGLDAPLPADERGEEGLRAVCAALIGTPQFLIAGAPGPDRARATIDVVPPGASYRERCEALASQMFGAGVVTCSDASLSVAVTITDG